MLIFAGSLYILPYVFGGCSPNRQINNLLKILTEKKHPQIKLQRFRKVGIWTFRWLIHQINSLNEVLKLKQNFRKNKVVTGKTPFFVICPFCTILSVCLNIGFWQSSFVWKFCTFNLSTFNLKTVPSFLKRVCVFSENFFQS